MLQKFVSGLLGVGAILALLAAFGGVTLLFVLFLGELSIPAASPEAQVAVLERKLNGQFENLAASQQDCETVAPFLEGGVTEEKGWRGAVTVRFVKDISYLRDTGVCSGTVVSDGLPKPREGLLFAAVSHRPGQVYCYSSWSTENLWSQVPGASAYPWKLQTCHDLYVPLVSDLGL